MNNLSVSNTATAATANVTIPSVVANVNPPNNRKPKKIATKTILPTHCNPKRKKDIDEDTDDNLFLDPPAVADHVPTYVCNWAQAIKCDFPQLSPLECSIRIAAFLLITSVNLPGSKGKDIQIQIPLHVTAAFTTHSTNTNK
jgi:hypothetical protein